MTVTGAVLTDTHCHLNMSAFNADRQEVLQRARTAGVAAILVPGIDVASSTDAVTLAEAEADVFAAVGVHPHDSKGWSPQAEKTLVALAANRRVVAIGEIGLDYYRDYAPREIQREAFSRQLELAASLERPVVIHQRDSLDDVLSTLSDWVKTLPPSLTDRPGVLHAFSGDSNAAEQAIGLGFYLGIGGPVTFKKADRIKQVVADVNLDHLLLETDAPYLAPHPMRGKRNEPGYLTYTAEAVAAIQSTTLDNVLRTTAENANHLFQWSEDPGDSPLS